ncbi:HEAT repeat domain-containing protein [Streptomyces massasporeus]|uniref:HEAT repeat domain-containing protein n=1 Tax=Streptomyces massasporeus TaxID=67324 RepID=UPI0036DFF8F0
MNLGKKADVKSTDTGMALAKDGGVANTGVMIVGELHQHSSGSADYQLTDEEMIASLQSYALRLRETYGRLDLEVLTPLSDQGEHPAVELREVFVAPLVRADPPPIELPRELMKRLLELGEISENAELPPGIRAAQLNRVREEYLSRPALDVLSVICDTQYERVVLLGDPGAGKSTLARYLALTLTSGVQYESLRNVSGYLPLVIELRRYAEERWRERTFEDFLDHLHATERMCVSPAMLRKCLSEGRFIAVFDGLDELFDPAIRKITAQRIAAFASCYPGGRIVVTSRLIGYQRGTLDGAGFKHYMLQDLTDEKIKEFARLWYRNACPDNPDDVDVLARRLTGAIDASKPIRELAGNPLLLTILSIIGRRQTLPRDRQGVYRHAVTVLVAHLDQDAKHLKQAGLPGSELLDVLDAEDRHEMLRLLARHMQEGHSGIAGNHIHARELTSIIREHLQQYELPPAQAKAAAQAMVSQLRERNFILSRYGGEVYGFVHRAFLEYLAAEDIAHRYKEDREWTPDGLISEVIGRHATDPSWHEVLLLIIGQLNERDTARAIDHLLQLHRMADAGDSGMLSMALRALAEVRKIGSLAAQSSAVIMALAHEMENAEWSSRETLKATLPALSTFGEFWKGRQLYLHWFHVRGQFISNNGISARAACELYLNPVMPKLLARYAPLASVRKQMLRFLAQHWGDHPGVSDLLLDRAISDPDDASRATAIEQLARWVDLPETLDLVRDRVVSDPDSGPRKAALKLLAAGWSGLPGTLDVVRGCAVSEAAEDVRVAALELLVEHWVDLPETLDLVRDRVVSDPDSGPRKAALKLFAVVGGGLPGTLDAVLRSATSPDFPTRQTALSQLVDFWPGQPEVLEAIRESATGDVEMVVRLFSTVVLATRYHDQPDTATVLYDRACSDPDPDLRTIALLMSFSHWSDRPQTLDLLMERIDSEPEGKVRGVALAHLKGWTKRPGIVDLLRERAISDPAPEARTGALSSLAASCSDYPEVRELVQGRVIADSDAEVREAALQLLRGKWKDLPETRDAIRDRALNESEPMFRVAALQIYGGTDESVVTEVLHRAENDDSPVVRVAAARMLAFGWPESPQTREILRRVAEVDHHKDVRSAAKSALNAVTEFSVLVAIDA